MPKTDDLAESNNRSSMALGKSVLNPRLQAILPAVWLRVWSNASHSPVATSADSGHRPNGGNHRPHRAHIKFGSVIVIEPKSCALLTVQNADSRRSSQ